ncbi:MAG: hypothetical protein ABH837_03155 [bacterium]
MYLREGWTIRVLLPLIPILIIGFYLLAFIDHLLGFGYETELRESLNLKIFDSVLFFLGVGAFYLQDWMWYKYPKFQDRLTLFVIGLGIFLAWFCSLLHGIFISGFSNIALFLTIILHFTLICFFGIGIGRAREWAKEKFDS